MTEISSLLEELGFDKVAGSEHFYTHKSAPGATFDFSAKGPLGIIEEVWSRGKRLWTIIEAVHKVANPAQETKADRTTMLIDLVSTVAASYAFLRNDDVDSALMTLRRSFNGIKSSSTTQITIGKHDVT